MEENPLPDQVNVAPVALVAVALKGVAQVAGVVLILTCGSTKLPVTVAVALEVQPVAVEVTTTVYVPVSVTGAIGNADENPFGPVQA